MGLGRPLIMLVFIAITGASLYYALYGEENLALLLNLKQENAQLRTNIANLDKDNNKQRAYIQELRDNPAIIEEEARTRLSLVKKGEVLFIFPQNTTD